VARTSASLTPWKHAASTRRKSHHCAVSSCRLFPGRILRSSRHAGYSYSGPAAAWAYKSLELSNAKRIFLLGPSHALYLPGCALSKHAKYATPLGDLIIDQSTVKELKDTGKFDTMSTDADETEHSMEMHLPYIYKMLSLAFKSATDYPPIIPILVGNTSASSEQSYGKILAPHLADPTSVFIISSDFCHWGLRFQYTYYLPALPSSSASGYSLKRKDNKPTSPPIHESIGRLDKMAMDAIETGKHGEFLDNLQETGNTVCGRHPIGVVLAAIEALEAEGKSLGDGRGKFKFVRYERSSEVEDITDSSVSYASAYATL
jgi:AmmeMemoRadiSam system protein B